MDIKNKYKIIVIDDELSMRDFFKIMLSKDGYDVSTFENGNEAIDFIKQNKVDLVITDLNMPHIGGIDVLREVKSFDQTVAVIVITAYASVDTAVDAMKLGAYDYFTKPFNVEDIKVHIKRALEWKELSRENQSLKEELSTKQSFQSLVGTNKEMEKLYETILSIAPTKASVLVTGESGTGKELVAKAVHFSSDRKDKPFVAVNCGAIPETLIESEFFGHKKGAFTGAVSDRQGLLGAAHGGTLFLDEITEMPLNVQVKFLRFLEERNYRQVGGTKDIDVDIRVISASNKTIQDCVDNKTFREDLYYRINVINLLIPPLRDRKDDIPILVSHFLERFNKELNKNISSVSDEVMDALIGYDYPGNVRELENFIERAVALEKSDTLMVGSFSTDIKSATRLKSPDFTTGLVLFDSDKFPFEVEVSSKGLFIDDIVSDLERKLIRDALKKTNGAKKKAAELLGLSFRSFRYKLKKYEQE